MRKDLKSTSFGKTDIFKGALTKINREGDMLLLYKELAGPDFSEIDLEKRAVKYKVFIGEGTGYSPDTIVVPKLLYGAEVYAQIEKEGNLINKLNEKYEKFHNLDSKHKDSFEKVIKVSEDYMKFLKKLDYDYRKAYNNIISNKNKNSMEKKELKKINWERRKDVLIKNKIKLHETLDGFVESLRKQNENADSKDKKSGEIMQAYETIISNAHFLLQDKLIIGSGNYADISFDADWISEHQGIIDNGDWEGSIIYRNLGLCNASILRFFNNGVLEYSLNEAYYDSEIIDQNDPREQTTFLCLSPEDQNLSKYEEFKTSPIYIGFKIPAKR